MFLKNRKQYNNKKKKNKPNKNLKNLNILDFLWMFLGFSVLTPAVQ